MRNIIRFEQCKSRLFGLSILKDSGKRLNKSEN